MTDKQILNKLQPLESKMIHYQTTNGGSLTADDIQIIKSIYSDLNDRTLNQLPRQFVTSCSSCVREVFAIVCSWYFRAKEIVAQEPLNETTEVLKPISKTTVKKSVGIKNNLK